MLLYLIWFWFAASFMTAYMLKRVAETGKPLPKRAFTFLVDPPTFLLVGLLAPMIGLLNLKGRKLTRGEFLKRRRVIDAVLVVFALGFWTMEFLTYHDVMGHPFDPTKSGNHFMWCGYVEMLAGWLNTTFWSGQSEMLGKLADLSWLIPERTHDRFWWNGLAMLLWLAQPAALWLGRSLGYNSAFFNDINNWSRPDPRASEKKED